MNLTHFGKIVRKARLDANVRLSEMANELGVSPAYLSGLETGRKKVSDVWVKRIEKYFLSKNIRITDLEDAAIASNKIIPVDGLSPQHQMLMAGFARIKIDPEIERKLRELLAVASAKGT